LQADDDLDAFAEAAWAAFADNMREARAGS